jgi:hypothetical protein
MSGMTEGGDFLLPLFDSHRAQIIRQAFFLSEVEEPYLNPQEPTPLHCPHPQAMARMDANPPFEWL